LGWNCPECGTLLTPRIEQIVRAYDAYFVAVKHHVCKNCGAEYITVFRGQGLENNYIGLIKLPKESKGR